MKLPKGWCYNGDMDLEYGGYFYKPVPGDDWVEAVRVTPCSAAGCQDNCWWVDNGTIVIPHDHRLQGALKCLGIDLDELPPETHLMAKLEACMFYGLYEHDRQEVVQIGPDEEPRYPRDKITATTRVRAGTDLRNWVIRHFVRAGY